MPGDGSPADPFGDLSPTVGDPSPTIGFPFASHGIDANGLLAVPFAVNAYYTPFLMNALWGRPFELSA